MYLFIYIFILIIGVLSCYYWTEYEARLLVSYQAERNRMQYELRQDINNILVDLKKEKNEEKVYPLLNKLSIAHYLSDRKKDGGVYFVDFLEHLLSKYALNKELKYTLYVDKEIYTSELKLSTRLKILAFCQKKLDALDHDNLVRFELEKDISGIVISFFHKDENTKHQILSN